ncbi:hypothetical protein [Roseivirga sp. UBA838]|uniref:hypothetical protein n=1 Tax=Roseivirga sp. UBA838 TaxID=1947393 RepID=UPI002580E7E9|nr:hypothetical protein [Roseivirga sp. UBA838]|tara:strand:+ start:9580 stop:11883 length:2304 start_codon:yes stop_codon:yes gene_type:complete
MSTLEKTEVHKAELTDYQNTIATAAGKIAEALVKKYSKEAAEKASIEILGIMTGGIATMVVGGFFDYFFPPQEQNAIDYTKIEDIMREVVNEQDLKNITTNIYATWTENIKDNYQTALPIPNPQVNGDDQWTEPVCQNLIQILNESLNSLIGDKGASEHNLTRLAQDHSIAGIPVYIFGVNLALAILQDKAMIYKMNKIPDQYFQYENLTRTGEHPGTIATTAETYAKQLDQNWQKSIEKRISTQYIGWTCEDHYMLNYVNMTAKDGDTVILTQRSDYNPNNGFFVNAHQSECYLGAFANDFIHHYYHPKTINAYCETMGYPDAIIDKWLSLKTSPMGTQSINSFSDNTDLFKPNRKDYFILDADSGVTSIGRNDRLYSVNRVFYLSFSDDGNLQIIRRADQTVFWSTDIKENTASSLNFDTDGQLQVVDDQGNSLWSAPTKGENYAILSNEGFLQVRSKGVFAPFGGNSIQWVSDMGMLPAFIQPKEQVAVSTYKCLDVNLNVSCIVYRQAGNDFPLNLFVTSSLDGLSWYREPHMFPNRMTTDSPPAAIGYNNAIQTVFKGNGNSNLYLNSSNPELDQFGGLVTYTSDATTDKTPSLYTGDGSFDVIYKGSGGTTSIWQLETTIPEASGTITNLLPEATDTTPCVIKFNGIKTIIYKSIGQTSGTVMCKLGGAAPQAVPNCQTSSTPAAVVFKNKLYIVFQGSGKSEQGLFVTSFDGTSWSPSPTQIKERLVKTDAPPSAIVMNNHLLVYYKGSKEAQLYCVVLD